MGKGQPLTKVLFGLGIAICCAATAFAQFPGGAGGGGFGGPSVLGRSQGAGMARPGQEVRLRYFASVRGVYDSALTAVVRETPTGGGQLSALALKGGELTWGLFGVKNWGKTSVSVAYQGAYRRYSGNSSLSGTDQFLQFGASRIFNRRWSFQTSNVAGTATRAFGLFGVITPAQTSGLGVGGFLNEVLDNRFYFANTNNTMVYMLTPRLSLSAGGGAFFFQRADNLISSHGVQARGDIAYRVSRNDTVSLDYQFFNFNFRGAFGNTAIQEAGLSWSHSINRNWTLSLRAGLAELKNEGISIVTLDPVIAQILGRPTGLGTFYRENRLPTWTGSLTGRWRHSGVSFQYQRLFVPGNGIQLTSRTEMIAGQYTWTGLRRWTFNARVGHNNMQQLLRFNANTQMTEGGGGVGWQFSRVVQFNFTAGYRRFVSTQNNFNRAGPHVSAGVSFSPGEIPLVFW